MMSYVYINAHNYQLELHCAPFGWAILGIVSLHRQRNKPVNLTKAYPAITMKTTLKIGVLRKIPNMYR